MDVHFWTQDWTHAWRLVTQIRSSIFLSEDCEDFVGKWCHFRDTSFFHTLDPNVNSLGSKLCSWRIESLDYGVSLVLDPIVKPTLSWLFVKWIYALAGSSGAWDWCCWWKLGEINERVGSFRWSEATCGGCDSSLSRLGVQIDRPQS